MSVQIKYGTYKDIKRFEPFALVRDTVQNIVTGQLYTCYEDGVLTPIDSLDEVLGSAGTVYWDDVISKPETYTPSTHEHPTTGDITEVDGGNL